MITQPSCLVSFYSSLGTCPDEETMEDTPKQLTVTLMDHQRKALSWLKWREDQIPRGGILGTVVCGGILTGI